VIKKRINFCNYFPLTVWWGIDGFPSLPNNHSLCLVSSTPLTPPTQTLCPDSGAKMNFYTLEDRIIWEARELQVLVDRQNKMSPQSECQTQQSMGFVFVGMAMCVHAKAQMFLDFCAFLFAVRILLRFFLLFSPLVFDLL
jgi:hypothetical protein